MLALSTKIFDKQLQEEIALLIKWRIWKGLSKNTSDFVKQLLSNGMASNEEKPMFLIQPTPEDIAEMEADLEASKTKTETKEVKDENIELKQTSNIENNNDHTSSDIQLASSDGTDDNPK